MLICSNMLSGHVHHDVASILGWQRSLVFEDDRFCFFLVTIWPTEVLARQFRGMRRIYIYILRSQLYRSWSSRRDLPRPCLYRSAHRRQSPRMVESNLQGLSRTETFHLRNASVYGTPRTVYGAMGNSVFHSFIEFLLSLLHLFDINDISRCLLESWSLMCSYSTSCARPWKANHSPSL